MKAGIVPSIKPAWTISRFHYVLILSDPQLVLWSGLLCIFALSSMTSLYRSKITLAQSSPVEIRFKIWFWYPWLVKQRDYIWRSLEWDHKNEALWDTKISTMKTLHCSQTISSEKSVCKHSQLMVKIPYEYEYECNVKQIITSKMTHH